MSNSTRRSSSFKVLPRNSPGDGELLHHYEDNGTMAATTRGEGPHRRRNRQKSKKLSLSETSIPLKLGLDRSLGPDLLGDGWYDGNLHTSLRQVRCYDGSMSVVSTPEEGLECSEGFLPVKGKEEVKPEQNLLVKAEDEVMSKQELPVKVKEELVKDTDDHVKAKYELVELKDEVVKVTDDFLKPKDFIKPKDDILKMKIDLLKLFDHESESASTTIQLKSNDPIDLSSCLTVDSNRDMNVICTPNSTINGILDLKNKDGEIIKNQDLSVEASFVDAVDHTVARQSSFGDGYNFDITYKAHVSPGPAAVIVSPFDYFVGEVLRSSSTSQVQSVENDKKREHVYNTMFHVPWRCELLIIVGFFVCLDSFLTLLTIMPVRVCIFLWRLLRSRRKFRRLRADELGDLGSLLVLVAGVTLLQQTDISYIYHMIRSQATIKLYVVYNVLEILDKLCQSFGSDVLQVLLNSAENVATCSHHVLLSEALRLTLDQGIAVFSSVLHSFIILAQSITVSAAIRSHNNALLTLLVSNNFAEIKSNVFKRLTKDNLHKLAYLDTVERFHIIAHLFFVLAQNLLAANEPWLLAFVWNAGIVFSCEVLVDVIKHAFLAKFNEIKPSAYSDFLLSLCEETLSTQSREVHKTMSFVPFAPACVVIRVLIPLYAAYLPGVPFWRFCCMFIYGITTYCFLVALKILISLILLKHASWYVARYKKKNKLYHRD